MKGLFEGINSKTFGISFFFKEKSFRSNLGLFVRKRKKKGKKNREEKRRGSDDCSRRCSVKHGLSSKIPRQVICLEANFRQSVNLAISQLSLLSPQSSGILYSPFSFSFCVIFCGTGPCIRLD